MRVRIARDELRRLRELTLAVGQLEREITELITSIAPRLLTEPGVGPLIAAKLVGEIAGAQRFATAAKLARAAGVAPIPAQLGQHAPPTARPRRQPPDQRCASPRDRDPRAATNPPATTAPGAAAKARAPARRSAASSATSPATSGHSFQPAPPRTRTSSPINFLT
jgi:hypothetical protein